MADLRRDPIINVIHNGIKESIRVTFDNDCWGATVILVYSGIDSMAYLNMPTNQEDVTRKDFIDWVERYIQFPCSDKVSGYDFYGARCGMLHQYGSASKLSREGKCREIAYIPDCKPEIMYDPNVSKELVMVSIKGLVDAFFKGIDRFLIDLFSDDKKAKVAEERFPKLVHVLTRNSTDKNK